MASKFLKNISKITGNSLSKMGDEEQISDIAGYIDTGSYMLNALFSGSIYGGIASNKITAIAGEEATGKTFFLLGLIKSHLDSSGNNEAIIFDTESAITKDMFNKRGVDGERVVVNSIATIEEFKVQMSKIVNELKSIKDDNPENMPNIFFALDSFGMLSTSKEMIDSTKEDGPQDMTRAKVAKATFRTLTMRLSEINCPLIITNHVYKEITKMFAPVEMSGGTAIRYSATSILYLSKKKEKIDGEVIGDIIHCHIDKSRLTKPYQQIDVLLSYESGINRYYGLEQLACEYGIFEKMDKGIKVDGKRVFTKDLLKNPLEYYTKEVLDKLDLAAKDKFSYGNSKSKQ